MSEHRALLIESASRLSIDHGRVRITRDGHQDSYVLPADIGVVVLHHPAIQMTGRVLQALAEAGASVIVTDDQHLPRAMLWPWAGNVVHGQRLRQQMAMDARPLRGELWSQIVRAKIAMQAALLREAGRNGAVRLERLAVQVCAERAHQQEAEAARHYWKHLFGKDFKRERQGAEDSINSRLNYGYTVLRALVARELSAAGLHPALGLGHRQMENPFNLADDFIEPYRHVVDRAVLAADRQVPFDGTARVELLGFLNAEVHL
jgi:CRISPR-associated protein Cas1